MKRFTLCIAVVVSMIGFSCTPIDPTNPPTVVASAENTEIREGTSIELSATGASGTAPYVYRWSIEAAPTGAATDIFSSEMGETVQAGPFDTVGEYTVRVRVTDAANRTAVDFLIITVTAIPPEERFEVSIDGADQLFEGTDETYTATFTYEGEVAFEWSIDDGEAQLSTTTEEETTLTAGNPGTILLTLTMIDQQIDRSVNDTIEITVLEESDLLVDIDGPNDAVVDVPFELNVSVGNGGPNLEYAWLVATGEATLENAETDTVTITPAVAGELMIEVTVTDADSDETASDSKTITVAQYQEGDFEVEAGQPRLADPGEVVSVSAEVNGTSGVESYFWKAITGDPIIDDVTSPEPTVTLTSNRTTHLRVTVTDRTTEGTSAVSDDLYIVVVEEPDPIVRFEIEDFGVLRFQLDTENAPVSCANFLSYIDEGFYIGTVIHRIETNPNFGVVQGGGYPAEAVPDYDIEDLKPTHDPIINESEFTMSNDIDTVAFARTNDPDSATSQWFVNRTDNSDSLDFGSTGNPGGFAVFGTMIEGGDVLMDIQISIPLIPSGITLLSEPATIIVAERE